MRLRELMTTAPASVAANSSIADAAKKMQTLDVGFLPVSEDGAPVGVITDRDIAVRGVAEGRDPRQTDVRDLMTPAVELLSEDDTVDAAVTLMKEKRIRRLLVRNNGGAITGVVTLGDIAVKTGNQDLSAEALSEISQPIGANR